MAKNSTPEEKPKVSKLPLPIADSPLVIDLPDGQKIVIGKMTQGSVIEVATWRGVGRPDSRTSRLMLGVGSGNVNEDQSANNSGTAPGPVAKKKPDDWRVVLFYLSQAAILMKRVATSELVKNVLNILNPVQLKRRFNRNTKSDKKPLVYQTTEHEKNQTTSTIQTSEDSVEEDVQAWLNRISERAAQKSASPKVGTKRPANKSAPVKKTTKRTATSKTKRK